MRNVPCFSTGHAIVWSAASPLPGFSQTPKYPNLHRQVKSARLLVGTLILHGCISFVIAVRGCQGQRADADTQQSRILCLLIQVYCGILQSHWKCMRMAWNNLMCCITWCVPACHVCLCLQIFSTGMENGN